MGGPEWHPALSVTHFPFFLSARLVSFTLLFSFFLSVSQTATGYKLIHLSIVAGYLIFLRRLPTLAGATESQITVVPQWISLQPPVGVGLREVRGRAVAVGPLRPRTFQPRCDSTPKSCHAWLNAAVSVVRLKGCWSGNVCFTPLGVNFDSVQKLKFQSLKYLIYFFLAKYIYINVCVYTYIHIYMI